MTKDQVNLKKNFGGEGGSAQQSPYRKHTLGVGVLFSVTKALVVSFAVAAGGSGGLPRRGASSEFTVQSALVAMRRASFRGSAVNVAGASGPRVRVEQERRLPIESLHLLSRHASGRV